MSDRVRAWTQLVQNAMRNPQTISEVSGDIDPPPEPTSRSSDISSLSKGRQTILEEAFETIGAIEASSEHGMSISETAISAFQINDIDLFADIRSHPFDFSMTATWLEEHRELQNIVKKFNKLDRPETTQAGLSNCWTFSGSTTPFVCSVRPSIEDVRPDGSADLVARLLLEAFTMENTKYPPPAIAPREWEMKHEDRTFLWGVGESLRKYGITQELWHVGQHLSNENDWTDFERFVVKRRIKTLRLGSYGVKTPPPTTTPEDGQEAEPVAARVESPLPMVMTPKDNQEAVPVAPSVEPLTPSPRRALENDVEAAPAVSGVYTSPPFATTPENHPRARPMARCVDRFLAPLPNASEDEVDAEPTAARVTATSSPVRAPESNQRAEFTPIRMETPPTPRFRAPTSEESAERPTARIITTLTPLLTSENDEQAGLAAARFETPPTPRFRASESEEEARPVGTRLKEGSLVSTPHKNQEAGPAAPRVKESSACWDNFRTCNNWLCRKELTGWLRRACWHCGRAFYCSTECRQKHFVYHNRACQIVQWTRTEDRLELAEVLDSERPDQPLLGIERRQLDDLSQCHYPTCRAVLTGTLRKACVRCRRVYYCTLACHEFDFMDHKRFCEELVGQSRSSLEADSPMMSIERSASLLGGPVQPSKSMSLPDGPEQPLQSLLKDIQGDTGGAMEFDLLTIDTPLGKGKRKERYGNGDADAGTPAKRQLVWKGIVQD